MRTRQAWRLNVAVVVVMTLGLLGGWGAFQGLTQGTPLAWAADAGDWYDDSHYRDKKDYDKDYDTHRDDFDHLACYDVYPYDKDSKKYDYDKDDDKDYVVIYNQFTKDKYGKYERTVLKVGKLRLLCVPTYKKHYDYR
jgi:hypothetical protein